MGILAFGKFEVVRWRRGCGRGGRGTCLVCEWGWGVGGLVGVAGCLFGSGTDSVEQACNIFYILHWILYFLPLSEGRGDLQWWKGREKR